MGETHDGLLIVAELEHQTFAGPAGIASASRLRVEPFLPLGQLLGVNVRSARLAGRSVSTARLAICSREHEYQGDGGDEPRGTDVAAVGLQPVRSDPARSRDGSAPSGPAADDTRNVPMTLGIVMTRTRVTEDEEREIYAVEDGGQPTVDRTRRIRRATRCLTGVRKAERTSAPARTRWPPAATGIPSTVPY
jgi:hypothetical protein